MDSMSQGCTYYESTTDEPFKAMQEELACSVGLENLSLTRRSSLSEITWKRWDKTLERIVPAIVALRVNAVRPFDTEHSSSSQATGFVVDAHNGIILTNRHVVHPGPIVAEAIFHDHEEVTVKPIYRDPVHDFGFFQFDKSKVRYMEIVEIPLRPDLARVGLDIRVIGNDAGEKLSILAGTLARLDRRAPVYGVGKYNDFNTFYLQAASGTSGGSSGSPVIDIQGNAVALNAGGKKKAASSYYLPLDRILRALKLILEGNVVSRGTLQTVFRYQPYDELIRLGLRRETEDLVRTSFKGETGMLTVEQVVPNGPVHSRLESGDILVSVNGKMLTSFVLLEEILDDRIGQSVALEIERGGEQRSVSAIVQDLHSITPNRYVEFSGAILHEISYQVCRGYDVPVQGVFVASSGYMLNVCGIPRNSILLSVDNQPTPNLDAFLQVVSHIPSTKRIPIRYRNLADPHRERIGIGQMDTRWYPFQDAVRDDSTGYWKYRDLPTHTEQAVLEPSTASFHSIGGALSSLSSLLHSMVVVEFHVPFPIDAVSGNNFIGTGLVLDAEIGLIIVDRNTVPISLGDLFITFAGSIILPGRLVFSHPYHNYVIISYEPRLLGATTVKSALLGEKTLTLGDDVYLVGLLRNHQIVVKSTVVTNRKDISVRDVNPPRFRAINLEGIEVSNPFHCIGGVLCDLNGSVLALWQSFSFQNADGDDLQFYAGIDTSLFQQVLDSLKRNERPQLRSMGIEFGEISAVEARAMGLSQHWLENWDQEVTPATCRKHLLGVRRTFAHFPCTETLLIKEGDIFLQVNGKTVTNIRNMDVEYVADFVHVLLLREGHLMEVNVPTLPFNDLSTSRVVGWSGALLHEPHMAVSMQRKEIPKGVYSSWWSNGSPAHMYGLRATVWITEINRIPVPDLDAFLSVIDKFPSETYVRVKLVDFNNKPSVLTLKTDYHYWPTWELRLKQSESLHTSEWQRIPVRNMK